MQTIPHPRFTRNMDKSPSLRSYVLLILLFSSFLMNVGISPISGEEPCLELEMDIRRIFGTSYDSSIEGHFNITCTGGDNITALSLLFNGTEVASSSTNVLSFEFDTDEFGPGLMNITLIGEFETGEFAQITEMKQFLPDDTTTVITAVMGGIAIVSVIVIVIYLGLRKKKQSAQPSTEDIKKRIKIDIDKDF